MISRPRQSWKTVLGIFILVTGGCLILSLSIFSGLRVFVTESLGDLIKSERGVSISVGNQYRYFSDRASFVKEATACFLASDAAAKADVDMKAIKAENDSLRKLLRFVQSSSAIPVVANIISRSTDIDDQILVIDRGSSSGILVGNPVVINDGIYVGSVVAVTPETASFRLVSDNASKVAVTVLNNDQSIGVLEGGYGLSLRVRFIPRNETVSVGDRVMTSGLEDLVPRGLAIGTVTVVENEPYQPFQEAVVSPIVDLNKLSIVSVLTNAR